MTSPTVGTAVRMIAGMSLRRARRSHTLWLALAVAVLLVGSAVVSLLVGGAGLDFFDDALDVLLRYVVPLVMLLLGSSAVSEEVQAKTITYLFSRPIPRWSLPLGKYVGAVLVGLVLLLPATALTYLITMFGEPGALLPEATRLLQGLLAVALAVLFFGAVAIAFGTMVTGYSFVAALFFLLIVEVGLSFAPGWIKVIVMTFHLRIVSGLYHPAAGDPMLPGLLAALIVLLLTGLWLVVAASWVVSTEYRTDR